MTLFDVHVPPAGFTLVPLQLNCKLSDMIGQHAHLGLVQGLVLPPLLPRAKLFALTSFRRNEEPVRLTRLNIGLGDLW